MKSIIPANIADQSWQAIFILCALAGIGVLALYSAAGGSVRPWAVAHAMRFGIFLTISIILSYMPPKQFKPLVIPAFVGSLFLLVLVLMIGVIGGGARSWLNLGVFQLQPSELVKLIMIAALARFYEMLPPRELTTFTAIWPPVLLVMIPFLLIVIQPDLGTAMLLLLTASIVMFLAGLPLRLFIGAGAAVMVIVPLAYQFLLLPHQKRRVAILLNPEADPLGAGYHITQSFIAIGSGGLTGKGFLHGSQSQLHYLPEQHTDFIFPAIAEEWGLLGGLLIIALLWLLLRWGMQVALAARGRFERLLAAGITASLFLYISINLMMVMGLAPVVGIPLPLVSYGGSAMLTVMLSAGLLMSIDRANRNGAGRSDF